MKNVIKYVNNPEKTTIPAKSPDEIEINKSMLHHEVPDAIYQEMLLIEQMEDGTTESIERALDYAINPDKTIELVSGLNCTPETAYAEMIYVKTMFNKLNNRQFVHFVQSFHPAEQVTPQQVHEIGVRLAREFERFSGFQIVVATHTNEEHLHNHFVINSVNMETGRKWQQSPYQMQQLKDFGDELCKSYGLSIIEEKDTKQESVGEHRAKERGESWMHELRLAVNACMKNSVGRASFMANMRKLGYEVKWTDTRKDITFFTPEGKRCRNGRLDKQLTKEALTEAFEFNREFKDTEEMADEIQRLELATRIARGEVPKEKLLVDQQEEESIADFEQEEQFSVEDSPDESDATNLLSNIEETSQVEKITPVQSQNLIKYCVDWSDRYKEGRAYLYGKDEIEQDFIKANQLFTEEAQKGNALAMYDLGRMYADGLGVDINLDLAQEWYSKAFAAFNTVESEEPNPYTQYRIGKMHATGLGTHQDFEEAAGWFQMAVDENHRYAQYSLAGLYYRGQGVEQNYEAAFDLYRKSAAQKNPYASYELAKMHRVGLGTGKNIGEADNHFIRAFVGFSTLEEESRDDKLQYRLGQMLYSGTGTEKSIPKAIDYLERSANAGNVNAQYLLAKIYLEMGDSLPENVQKAFALLERAADGGNAQTQYALAKLLVQGKHVERDITRALVLFTSSAEQNNQFAAYALGKLYLAGAEIPKDSATAIKWLTASADLGNSFAQYSLGKLYLADEEIQVDIPKAIELLTQSAEQQNQYAQYMLGKIHLYGEKVPKDIVQALKWLTASAHQVNQFAQYRLGKLYVEGDDVPKDVEVGLQLLKDSAEQGNQFAQFKLGAMYLSGKDVPRDKEIARSYLTMSAERGNEIAKIILEDIDSYNVSQVNLLMGLIEIFSSENRDDNSSNNHCPLSRLEGLALREKILEKQFGSNINWSRGHGYER